MCSARDTWVGVLLPLREDNRGEPHDVYANSDEPPEPHNDTLYSLAVATLRISCNASSSPT